MFVRLLILLSVIGDLLRSGEIPTIHLTTVFRQAESSQIITHAHKINQGLLPRIEPLSMSPQSDCLWIELGHLVHSIDDALYMIVKQLLPNMGFNPTRDLQVDMLVLCLALLLLFISLNVL
jgi:exodeoxyribonuclease V alpha subunit